MDALKVVAVEEVVRMIESYGPQSAAIVVELRDLPKETFDKIPGEAETYDVSFATVHIKRHRVGSGVFVNASYVEKKEDG